MFVISITIRNKVDIREHSLLGSIGKVIVVRITHTVIHLRLENIFLNQSGSTVLQRLEDSADHAS